MINCVLCDLCSVSSKGSSKGAKKEVDERSRDDITEEIASEVIKNIAEIGEVADAEMHEAVQNINRLTGTASQNSDFVYLLMSRFSRPNLVKFNNVNGLTDRNNEQKYKTLKSIVFSESIKKFKAKEAQMRVAGQAMENCVKFLVNSKYLSDANIVQWSAMRADTEGLIKQMDEATGAAAAREQMAAEQQRAEQQRAEAGMRD